MLTLRPNTTDLAVYTEVCIDNEYRLPDRMDGMRVLDLGAHIGCFALAAMSRGAFAVDSFESDPGNYRILESHARRLGRVVPHHGVVWRSDQTRVALEVGKYELSHNPAANGVFTPSSGVLVRACALDAIVENFGPFDLCKIDIEVCEYPVLFTSQRVKEIPAICGEWHSAKGDAHANFGLGEWTPQHLRQHLRDLGYTCEFWRQTDFAFQGMFWAWTGVCPFKEKQPLPQRVWSYSATGGQQA